MANNITVEITAETSKLQAKLAVAQANFRSLSSEMNAAAKAALGLSGDARTLADLGLEAIADKSLKAQAAVAGLRAELAAAVGAGAGGFTGIKGAVDEIGGSIRSITSLAGDLGVALTAGFGVERIVEWTRAAAEAAEQMEALSARTGLSITALEQFHFAAAQTGVATDAFDRGLTMLSRTLGTALADPAGKVAQAFHNLGADQPFLIANANDLVAVYLRLADGFQKYKGAAAAAEYAQALFMRGGAEQLPLLQQGAAGLAAMAAEFKALGGGPTQERVEQLAAEAKALNKAGTAWEGYFAAAFPPLAPAVPAWVTDRIVQLHTLDDALREHDRLASGAGAPGGAGGATGSWSPATPGASPGAASGAPAAGAPGAPQLATLTEPVSALEAFRTKLAEVKADMEAQGASALSILAREAAMWREIGSAAGLTATEQVQAERSYADARAALIKAEEAQSIAAAKGEEQARADSYRTLTEVLRQSSEAERAADRENAKSKETELAQIRAVTDAFKEGSVARVAAARSEVAQVEQAFGQQSTQAIASSRRLTEAVSANDRQMGQALEAFTGPAKSAFDGFITDALAKHQSLAQSFDQVVAKMVNSWITAIAKMTLQFLAFEAVTAAFPGATGIANLISPGGAGGLFGGLGSIIGVASGTANVPRDMLAMLHQGEMVIPAEISASFRSASTLAPLSAASFSAASPLGGSASGGGAAAATAAGGTTLAPNFTFAVQAIDAAGVAAFFNGNAKSMASTVSRYLANNSGARGDY